MYHFLLQSGLDNMQQCRWLARTEARVCNQTFVTICQVALQQALGSRGALALYALQGAYAVLIAYASRVAYADKKWCAVEQECMAE